MPRFIPSFILHKVEKGLLTGDLSAYVILFDIVDFTVSCGKLFQMEKGGVEILSRYLGAAFHKPIEYLVYYGGFVSSFSGDSCTVIMPKRTPEEVLCSITRIQEHFEGISEFEGLPLRIRLSVSFGNVHWRIFNNPHQYEYVFTGEAFEDNIELQSLHKELLFSTKAAQQIGLDLFEDTEGGYIPKATTLCDVEARERPLSFTYKPETRQLFCHKDIPKVRQTEENRQAGYCFISLKGIPEPEVAQTIQHIELLSAKYYGMVNKLECSDKGFLAIVIFGIPHNKGVFFENMCRFALELIGYEPKLRMGLSIGYVLACFVGSTVSKEYTAYGYPMNLAARLMSEARCGEVITDTYLRNQLDTQFFFHKLKTIKPKGFDTEVTCYRLNRQVSHDDMFSQNPFVGREKEQEEITQFILKGFEDKDNRVVYIHGDPGIGKSRLIETALGKISKDVCNYLTVKCNQTEQRDLEIVTQLLNKITNYNPWTPLSESKAMFHGLWEDKAQGDKEMQRIESIIGSIWGYEWPGSNWSKISDIDKPRQFRDAFVYAINFMSKASPFMIRLEDAQWIDDTSKQFFRLLTETGNGNVVFVCSCRYEHGNKIDLKLPKCTKYDIELTRLTFQETAELVRNLVNPERNIPKETVEFIDGYAEGVPLFVEQLTLDMRGHDTLDNNGVIRGKPKYKRNLKIYDVLDSRIDNLTDNVREALFRAAVLGNQFYVELLSKMLDSKLETELEQGEKNRIWQRHRKLDKSDPLCDVEELQYIFNHVMIHKAAYDRMMDNKRSSLHFAAALAMERLYGTDLDKHAEDIGRHYESAQLLDPAAAMYCKAAEYYKKTRNYLAAARCYKKALDAREKQDKESRVLSTRPDTVPTINNWAEQMLNLGGAQNVAEASILLKKALEINLNCQKQIMCDKASTLEMQAKIYQDSSQFQQAVDLLNEALSYRKKNMDEYNPIIGKTYNELGNLYSYKGETKKAIAAFKQAIKVWNNCNKQFSPEMADSMNDLARLYDSEDNKEEARVLFDKALAMRRETLGNDHIDLTETLNDYADFLIENDQLKEAEALLEEALRIRINILGINSLQVAETYNSMGIRYKELDDFENAAYYLEQALSIRKQHPSANKYDLAESYQSFGDFLLENSDYQKALENVKQALEIREDILDSDHPDIAESLNSLANIYTELNMTAEAEECYSRSGKILEKLYVSHHHSDLAKFYKDRANSYIETNQYKMAEKLLHAALKINISLDGEKHLDTAEILDDLGRLYTTLGNYAEAESYLNRALAIRIDLKGENSIDAAETSTNLGVLYYEMKNKECYPKAEALLSKSLAIRTAKYSDTYQDEIAESMIELAKIYVEMDEFAKASYYLKRAMVIYRHTHGIESPEYADGLDVLASLLRDKDKLEESAQISKEAMDIRAKLQGTEHPDYAESINILATTYTDLDQHEKAFDLLQKALQIRKKSLGEEHPDVSETMNDMVESLREQDKFDESKAMFKNAMMLRRVSDGEHNLDWAEMLHNIGLVYLETGEYDKAKENLELALKIRQEVRGQDHTEVAESQNDLALLYTRMGVFGKALPLYQSALKIRTNGLDPRHTEVADTLHDMGVLYHKCGEKDKARECFSQALEIRVEKRGANSEDALDTKKCMEALEHEIG